MSNEERKADNAPLKILYRDDYLVAVDKPAGVHVHRSELSPHEDSVMRMLRDQLNQWVYPVHRLDRAVSGALVFALSSEAAKLIIEKFTRREISKQYIAIVRGYLEDEGIITHPLRETPQSAPADCETQYNCKRKFELPIPLHQFPTVRYSLAEISPLTGRRNQIRRHMAHISHPIVGDVRFGDGRHNRLFREQFDCHQLLLFARRITFRHPCSDQQLVIEAEISAEFHRLIREMGGAATSREAIL